MKVRIFILIQIFVVFVFMSGCDSSKEQETKTKKPQRVEIAKVRQARIVEKLETTGDVIAANTVTLEATVEGYVSFCPWRESDRIKSAGQKLIEIDRPLYKQELVAAQAALAVAEAQLADITAGARPEEIEQAEQTVRHLKDCTDFAKADFDRIKTLVKSGSLPAETVEKARVDYVKCQTQLASAKQHSSMLKAGPTKTELAVAQALVTQAMAKVSLTQATLDECVLKAPFAGIITEVYVREGDLATPRAKLIKMMDPDSLVVRAGIAESSAIAITKDSQVSVQLDAYPGNTFNAKIERVYPRLENQSRTRIIEVKITDPVDLIPQLFARVSIEGRIVEDAIVVPDAAIVSTPRGQKVVYVVHDGKAKRREVTIGLEENENVQILEGLTAGETVIIEGNLNLKDGVTVSISETVESVNKTLTAGGDK